MQIVVGTVGAQKFLLNVVSAVFVFVYYDYSAGLVLCNLTAKLRAYGAAAARNHNDFVVDIACYAHIVESNLLTTEKVGDIDIAHLFGDIDVGNHFADKRQDLNLALCCVAVGKYALSCFASERGDSEYNGVDSVLLHAGSDFLGIAYDFDVVDNSSEFIGVVVDKADRIINAVLTRKLIEYRACGVACADNHSTFSLSNFEFVSLFCIYKLVNHAAENYGNGREETEHNVGGIDDLFNRSVTHILSAFDID